MNLTFTPSEAEILLHRLEVPDCLADALEEEFPRDKVEALASMMAEQAKAGNLVIHVATEPEALAILADCCNGSTFFNGGAEDAISEGALSKGKYLSQLKAARSLEEKFAKIGVRVSIPQH